MKVNELRIGNFLFVSVEDIGVIQVTEIKNMVDNRIGNMSICYYGVNGGYSTTSLEENSNNNEIYDYMIQPILLTEEWLLKFGFKENKGYYTENEYGIISFYFNHLDELTCEVFGWRFENIKYVHHLQNLYFGLIGEELTIK
jgi:hypothetical protein